MNASKKQNSLIDRVEVGISENKASYSVIHVSHFRNFAACETSEHCFTQYFRTVHLSPNDVTKERRPNGRLQSSNFRTGDIYLTPATIRLQEPCELIGLHIKPAFLAQLTAELVLQFKFNEPLIYQIAIALKTQFWSSEEWQRLYIESMATAISAYLLQQYSTCKPKVKTYSAGLSETRLRVTEYIHEQSDQNLSLVEMAQQVQMSLYDFSRLFKKSIGLSQHKHLIGYCIQQAERLFMTTALSIAEILAQVGFVDRSHLARHFKRQFGMPHSQFCQIAGTY